jgi:hypothetical protein
MGDLRRRRRKRAENATRRVRPGSGAKAVWVGRPGSLMRSKRDRELLRCRWRGVKIGLDPVERAP